MNDPYTKIEMMALADVYDQRAEFRRIAIPPPSRPETTARPS